MKSVVLHDISKKFGKVQAVDGVSLTVENGEFFFLLGPSGCGKTTLLRIIAGFTDPDAGDVLFGDQRINDVPAHRRNTGMVFQNYALWPHMNVYGNVEYGLSVRKVRAEERRARVRRALEMVRLDGLEKRKPNELSGGQQQRVALARALVIEPDLLLLDEPLSNLDAKLRLEMRRELRRIHAETGITTIYVTHDQKEALSLAGRMAVMRAGRVEQVGAPREVYMNPANNFVAGFIGQANVLRGRAEPQNGETIIRTPYGAIRANGIFSGEVACCIRPEAFRIASSAEADNRMEGVVTEVTYLGDQEQVVLHVQSPGHPPVELLLLLHNPSISHVETGQTLAVSFAPQDVIIIK